MSAALALPRRHGGSERRLLRDARPGGPMPWIVAVIAFLAALAAVAGLALDAVADGLGPGLARRLTVQIVAPAERERQRQAAVALRTLRADDAVEQARAVPAGELDRLLAPWLGPAAGKALPLPAMIDVELVPGAPVDALTATLARVAPAARIERHDAALAPLAGFVAALRLLAAALVALMTAAVAAVVVLAARAALLAERETVEVLHLLGAADTQIARLFAGRLARDTLIGAALGSGLAELVLWALGRAVAALDSGLAALAAPGGGARAALLLLPLAVAGIAWGAARLAVGAVLRRAL